MSSFFDTNVLLYLFETSDDRYLKARRVIETADRPHISVQVLNEFATVARRAGRPWPAIRSEIERFKAIFVVTLITVELHDRGLGISERYGYGVYDSMLLAAAVEAGCEIFWSEDLHDGQVIDGRLTIRNPFA